MLGLRTVRIPLQFLTRVDLGINGNGNFSYLVRNESTFKKPIKDEAVVVSEDGKVIVFWHPETHFPYELTKALPKEMENTSFLKAQEDTSYKKVYHRNPYIAIQIKKLQELTYTNKHIWYPRKDRKLIKFKEKQPKDREFL